MRTGEWDRGRNVRRRFTMERRRKGDNQPTNLCTGSILHIQLLCYTLNDARDHTTVIALVTKHTVGLSRTSLTIGEAARVVTIHNVLNVRFHHRIIYFRLCTLSPEYFLIPER